MVENRKLDGRIYGDVGRSAVEYRDLHSRCTVKDETMRLCLAALGAAIPRDTHDNGVLSIPIMSAAACDLSVVSLGRVPLLIEHNVSLDSLIGVVEAAHFDEESGALMAILRFGTSVRAEAAWCIVRDNLPLRISMGYSILEEERPDDGSPILHTRWQLNEVSLCVQGKDPLAILMAQNAPGQQRRLSQAIGPLRRRSLEQRRDVLLEQLGAVEAMLSDMDSPEG